MSYGDFFIRYEYTFLKNIYTKDELRSAPQIRTLGDYYKTFQKFIKILQLYKQSLFLTLIFVILMSSILN